MARMEHGLEGAFRQVHGVLGRIADAHQRPAQGTPAQFAETVLEGRLRGQDFGAYGPEVFHRQGAQGWGMFHQPVAHGRFGALDHRAVVPEGVVQVEGDQSDAHSSPPRRLALGCAWS
ncbi:hypothetical protein D9M71_577980 [compost metagenome]